MMPFSPNGDAALSSDTITSSRQDRRNWIMLKTSCSCFWYSVHITSPLLPHILSPIRRMCCNCIFCATQGKSQSRSDTVPPPVSPSAASGSLDACCEVFRFFSSVFLTWPLTCQHSWTSSPQSVHMQRSSAYFAMLLLPRSCFFFFFLPAWACCQSLSSVLTTGQSCFWWAVTENES